MRLNGQEAEEEAQQEELEPEEENSQWQDEDESTLEDTEESQENEPEPEAEEEQQEPAVPAYVAASDDPDLQLLMETLGPEAAQALLRLQQRQSEAATVASLHLTAAASQHPELFRVYGARIQQSVSRLDPSLRSRPEGVNIAVANALLEEAQAKGLGPALAKFAALAGGKAPAKAAARSAIPAEQRPPSPGNGSRGTVRPLKGREASLEQLIKDMGLTRAEAEMALIGS